MGAARGIAGSMTPEENGVFLCRDEFEARFFTGPYQRREIPMVGHNTPQEAPAAVTAAILELLSAQRSGDRRAG